MISKHVRFCTVLCAVALSSAAFAAEKKKAAPAPEKKAAMIDQMGGQGYGTAGCGLGSIIFGDKPGMIQLVAGTTNSLYSHQSFAITSGTSNCGGGKSAHLFIENNKEQLARDMARGNGETLVSLSGLMGCADSVVFGKVMQQGYNQVFTSATTSTEDISTSIETLIKTDSVLSRTCHVG